MEIVAVPGALEVPEALISTQVKPIDPDTPAVSKTVFLPPLVTPDVPPPLVIVAFDIVHR
jgi:hypothetical protein